MGAPRAPRPETPCGGSALCSDGSDAISHHITSHHIVPIPLAESPLSQSTSSFQRTDRDDLRACCAPFRRYSSNPASDSRVQRANSRRSETGGPRYPEQSATMCVNPEQQSGVTNLAHRRALDHERCVVVQQFTEERWAHVGITNNTQPRRLCGNARWRRRGCRDNEHQYHDDEEQRSESHASLCRRASEKKPSLQPIALADIATCARAYVPRCACTPFAKAGWAIHDVRGA